MGLVLVAVNHRRDFRRHDFGLTSPKYNGVKKRDADFFEICIDSRIGFAGGLTCQCPGSETESDWNVIDGDFTLSKS